MHACHRPACMMQYCSLNILCSKIDLGRRHHHRLLLSKCVFKFSSADITIHNLAWLCSQESCRTAKQPREAGSAVKKKNSAWRRRYVPSVSVINFAMTTTQSLTTLALLHMTASTTTAGVYAHMLYDAASKSTLTCAVHIPM